MKGIKWRGLQPCLESPILILCLCRSERNGTGNRRRFQLVEHAPSSVGNTPRSEKFQVISPKPERHLPED